MAQFAPGCASSPRASVFCPPVDAATLLQFRTDALLARMDAPHHQQGDWLAAYRLIVDFLERSDAGPVQLGLS